MAPYITLFLGVEIEKPIASTFSEIIPARDPKQCGGVGGYCMIRHDKTNDTNGDGDNDEDDNVAVDDVEDDLVQEDDA